MGHVSALSAAGDLVSILRGFNPWWARRPFEVPEFRRLAFQICNRRLRDQQLRRAVLLTGPRRVGKTTILTQIAKSWVEEGRDPKSILYLSLDHPILKLASLSEILRLYHENVHPEGKATVLLLDEVQYADEWDFHVKQLIDRKPEYRILATGSASVVQRHQLVDTGVGRWTRVPIPTLSFYEFLRIRGDELPGIADNMRPVDLFRKTPADLGDIGERSRSLMPLFRRYLLVGGFPETAHHPDIAFCQRLLREDVVERVLKRDMTALFGIRNVNDLERLFIYLCLNSGGIFSTQTCAKELGATTATVGNHLEALEHANLIYRLRPSALGGKKVLKARYKVYLVDAALCNAVLLRGEEIIDDPGQVGPIVETTILRHLFAYHYQDTPQILYWRDAKSGREVDIVVKSPKYTIPVEVKYRADASLSEKDGIVEYCRAENPSFAYCITQQERDFDLRNIPGVKTKLLRVPAHIFAYLIGQAERALWAS